MRGRIITSKSQLTSRRTDGGAQCSGSRGARGTRANLDIPLPSGSLPISPLKPINLSQARFNEALALALLINFGIWGLLALAVWALFF